MSISSQRALGGSRTRSGSVDLILSKQITSDPIKENTGNIIPSTAEVTVGE
jgi:hypothetical protein